MKRVIMHVDMNAFFASVEQKRNPSLRGRPVAVVGRAKRSVVTTASYEARALGVKTGMNMYEAKRVCPGLIIVIGDNRRYIDASLRILDILKKFSPRVEPFSIDEAFLDLTGIDLFGGPLDAAMALKRAIREGVGLPCSIGVGPNKLISKLASGMKKPDGLVLIEEERVPDLLEELPVEELWGIGRRLGAHLRSMGINTCGQLARAPASVLRRRFGITGERLKDMARGIDTRPVVPVGREEEVKSIGHSTTLPRDLSDRDAIKRCILKLSEMVARRARRYRLMGRRVCLTIRYPDFHTFGRFTTLPVFTNDTFRIYRGALSIFSSVRLRAPVRLLGVSISSLVKDGTQLALFEEDRRRESLLHTMDHINDRFGELALTWSTILEEQARPDVISPAWRPSGVRRTIA